MKPKILVVDDEPDAAELIEFNLKNEGYKVATANDGKRALEKIRSDPPDLVILDLMLPEIDGLEICRLLRKREDTSQIRIIMLTAKAAEIDRVVGLELGADDYVTKPFSPRELVLRVKNLLRRPSGEPEKKTHLVSGILQVDIPRHEVTVEGEAVQLTPTEFKLLTLLMQRAGRVQTRDRLLQDVWDYETMIDTRTVDTHMRRLREKLKGAARFINTVRGVGYRFVGE